MAKTVVGMIENASEAQKVVEELLRSGFDRVQIGIISSEVLNEAASAVTGATAGMAIGGVAGMLLAAAAVAIPGIGPVIAAGPALALLAGTMVGAVAGGLIGGLKSRGVPEDEAHFYAEGLRRGGTLVTVNADNDELADRAVEIMRRHGAVDMQERAAEWKKEGWSGRYEEREDAAAPAQRDKPAAMAPGSATEPRREPASAAASVETRAPQGSSAMRAAADAPLQAGRTVPNEEPALAAVQVYSFVIEVPAEETLEDATRAGETYHAATPANQPRYGGAERRMHKVAFSGADRRHAA
jgi:hypothetical protein